MRNSLTFSADWILLCSQKQTGPQFFRWLGQDLECLQMNWSPFFMPLLETTKLIGFTKLVDLHWRAKLMPSVTKTHLHGMGMLLFFQQPLCHLKTYLSVKLNLLSYPVLVIPYPFLTERKSTTLYSVNLQPILTVQPLRLCLERLLIKVL